jgi:hypothetical protein
VHVTELDHGCVIMDEMSRLMGLFAGHPARIGAGVTGLLLVAGAGWYLGSPLFIRTYSNEALPAAIATRSPSPSTTGTLTEATATPATPRVLRSGELGFVDAIHNGKGPVRIIEVGRERFVRFEDVMLTNAPDVHVYLSREIGGKWSESTSLYLGPLKATNGSFNYEVSASEDLSSYRSVVVWCRAFSVLITWADLR